MRTEPDEDLQLLWDKIQSDGLDYAFLRLGEVDPDRADIGTVDESEGAKIQGGHNWWGDHYDEVKKFVCQNGAIRKEGPITILQAIFGVLAHTFGGPLATYATIILVKRHFGSLEAVGKDALDQWCGNLSPMKRKPARKVAKKRTRKRK